MDMRKLINLIETPDEVRATIINKVEKIPDEGDLRDVLKYTNRFALKPTVSSFTQRYKTSAVQDVILQSLTDADIDLDTVENFLKVLDTTGVIKVDKLLAPAKIAHWSQIIDPRWASVVNAIKSDLYNKLSGKIGEKGDVGKGEFLLDILSPEIERRGAPGDIRASGKNIEVKAGKNGRLGPSGTSQLLGRFDEFAKAVFTTPQLKQKWAASGEDMLIFNPLANMNRFSAFFDNDTKQVKAALTKMLTMHFPGGGAKDIPNQVVGGNGAIDGRKLLELMLGVTLEAYKKAKDFDAIILIDEDAARFLYLETADQVKSAYNTGIISVSPPRWEDAQSNCFKITMGASAGRAQAPAIDVGSIKPTSLEADRATVQIENFIDDLAAKYNIMDEDLKDRMVLSALTMYHDNVPAKKLVAELQKQFPELANKPVAQTSTTAEPAPAPVAPATPTQGVDRQTRQPIQSTQAIQPTRPRRPG